MMREKEVREWAEVEELVYSYLVLNPCDVHGFIRDAFLSLVA
ncbi:hypothetical protein AMTRI_Chr01g108490 [Amborella trichopoda]